jgi:hypothetical protein
MIPPSVRMRVIYRDDAGRKVWIGVLRRYGEHPDLGFEAVPQPLPRDVLNNPTRFKPRFITAYNPDARTRLQVPVGCITARAWQPSTASIDLLDPTTRRVATFQVKSRTGERWD